MHPLSTAVPDTAVVHGWWYPGYGGTGTRSTSAPTPWYGSGTTPTPLLSPIWPYLALWPHLASFSVNLKSVKNSDFHEKQWFFALFRLFSLKPYPNPEAFRTFGQKTHNDTTMTPPIGHSDRSAPNPIQSQGLLVNLTVFHEKCVENGPFSDVRFVGDILRNFSKNGDFHVFLNKIWKFAKSLGKT